MKLYLTRHTRTNYNDLHLCNSDPNVDVHLTEVGLQQAAELAEKLKALKFERIIISPLFRTKQTADILNRYHNVPTEVDARLIDNRTGFEDKTYEEYEAVLNQAADTWNFRGRDGESLNDVKARAAEFLQELKGREFQAVLVVTHEVVIKNLVGVLEGLSNQQIWDVQVPHGEYRSFDI